jgi:type IV pilus assembly protein PilC
MPTFDYSAEDEQGRPCSGQVDAPTRAEAESLLKQRGWTVIALQTIGGSDRTPIREWVGDEASATSTGRLAQAPLTLVLSLQALSEELPASRGRSAVAAVARRMESGEALEPAFRAEQSNLPRELRGLMELGLPSGRVDFLIQDYLEHCRRVSDLRRSVWVSLAYPVVLLLFLFGVLQVLFLLIVPMFKRIFEDFGTSLPGVTLFVVHISDTLLNHWLTLLIVFVGIPAILYAVLRALGGAAAPQTAFRTIPILGRSFRWASLSNFCHLLATLVELGVPLPQALRATAGVTDDLSLADGVRRAAESIEQGETPREAVYSAGSWVSELAPAFHWADRGGDFAESLRASGEVFGARSRVQSNLLFWVLEPVFLFLIAISVGLVAVALFMPLIKLLNDLS